MNVAAQRSQQLAVGLLFGFGALLGLAVAPTIAYYVEADPQAVWLAGGATALFMAGETLGVVSSPRRHRLSYAVQSTRRDEHQRGEPGVVALPATRPPT